MWNPWSDKARVAGQAHLGPCCEKIIATDWKAAQEKLARHPASAANYLIDGRAPRHGELFKSPDLAKTFRIIADEGPDAFYRGALARKITEFIASEGGSRRLRWARITSEQQASVGTSDRRSLVLDLDARAVLFHGASRAPAGRLPERCDPASDGQ